jgi:hypothetical protein
MARISVTNPIEFQIAAGAELPRPLFLYPTRPDNANPPLRPAFPRLVGPTESLEKVGGKTKPADCQQDYSLSWRLTQSLPPTKRLLATDWFPLQTFKTTNAPVFEV